MKQSPANGPRLLHSLTLSNLLSFGPKTAPLPLERLNVLIGPNGSGKSNLLEAISLLKSSPTDLRPTISNGGGVGEWIWKGAPAAVAAIEASVAKARGRLSLRHLVAFSQQEQSYRLDEERIRTGKKNIYKLHHGRARINIASRGARREVNVARLDPDLSILAQRRDPEKYPEITYLASVYDRIQLYREWAVGHKTRLRIPQRADLRVDRLEEDFSNLGLFLKRVCRKREAKELLLGGLRNLYDGLTDFDVRIEAGTVQVFFSEGDFTIPATRLSDGSLRYLCLLAILCDPNPPLLIGIEEPELGLHPDLLPKVADLLKDASKRTQIIVTTHSDSLVDALTDQPSAIIVCEKRDGQTTFRRLNPAALSKWLENYRLGQLWTRGQLGGTRC